MGGGHWEFVPESKNQASLNVCVWWSQEDGGGHGVRPKFRGFIGSRPQAGRKKEAESYLYVKLVLVKNSMEKEDSGKLSIASLNVLLTILSD